MKQTIIIEQSRLVIHNSERVIKWIIKFCSLFEYSNSPEFIYFSPLSKIYTGFEFTTLSSVVMIVGVNAKHLAP